MNSLFERVLLLKRSPYFAEVGTEELAAIAGLLTEECFDAGEQVFSHGDRGDEMYLIISGAVGIALQGEVGGFVRELGPGDCFGEMGVLDQAPRSATVEVLAPTTLLALDGARLRRIMLRHPEIALGIIRALSARLRAMESHA